MKALIVDDSATMRRIQIKQLTRLGIVDIREAADGAIALGLFEEECPDFILTDWNMPNMNGLDFLKAIRKRNREIPVIMITTEAERGRVVEAIQAGVTDYITKPFTPDTLGPKLARHVAVNT